MLLKMQFLYRRENLVCVIFWTDFTPDLANNAILIDQESLAVHAHELLAVHIPLFIDIVELRDAGIRIGEQREGQAILVGELLMGRHIIGANAQNDDAAPLHTVIRIAEAARLLRATWGIIFGQLDTCRIYVFPRTR